jgi:protein-disulfide isomerase
VNATGQMSTDGVNGTPTVFIDGKNQGTNPNVAVQNLQPLL